MDLKKFLVLLVALMTVTFSASAAVDESASTRLVKIEIDTYGGEQSGALLDRISRLEKDYSGQNMTGNMNARIEAIWDTLYNNAVGPGILAKINALEWNTNHEVQGGGIDMRLTALENQIIGKTVAGTFNERIRALAKASYGEEILPIAQVQIPANTLIKVETTAPAASKTLQEGDTIPVRVVEDVFVNDNLVFARGLPGEGTVTRVLRAKNIFSNGKIETDFNTLKAIDGQTAVIFTGLEAIDQMNANGMGRGLSLIGQTFSGKNKDVEEVFIRGKNIDLPAGVTLYVQIKEPIVVYGVRADGVNGLLVDEMIKPAPVNNPPSMDTPVNNSPSMNMPVNNPPSMDTPVDNPPSVNPPVNNPSSMDMPVDNPPPADPPANNPPPVAPSANNPTAPETTDPSIETRPDEGKTPNGSDGEIIEIIDEE